MSSRATSKDSKRSRLSNAGGFGVDTRVDWRDVGAVLLESSVVVVDTVNEAARKG